MSNDRSFAEIYGPDGNGDYMVVERASNFVTMITHMKDFLGAHDAKSFHEFRVWWYEEILHFLQHRNPTECVEQIHEPDLTNPYPQYKYILVFDISAGWSMLNWFYQTFEFWKAIVLLGDKYPGI